MGPIKSSLFLFALLFSLFSSTFAESDEEAGISWNSQSDIDHDNQNVTNVLSPDEASLESQVIAHLSSKVQTCIRQTPLDHGLLFHIEDKSDEFTPITTPSSSADQRLLKRGLLGSMSNGWKAMPFDQRLSVIGTIASTASVPMYLMGAVSTTKRKRSCSCFTDHRFLLLSIAFFRESDSTSWKLETLKTSCYIDQIIRLIIIDPSMVFHRLLHFPFP